MQFSLTAGLAALLATQASAHFLLLAPPTAGFDDDAESTGPCGGATINLNNATDFHVGGDAISLRSTHPTTTYLFRVTSDSNVASNFTTLRQPIQQSGLGFFCEPNVVVPASFAGTKGVLQVVANGPDGILYQCSALNFVTGTGTQSSSCTNGTGVSAAYVTDATLSALTATNTSVTNGTMTSNNSTNGTTTTSSGAGTSTSAKSAASALRIDTLASVALAGGVAYLASLL